MADFVNVQMNLAATLSGRVCVVVSRDQAERLIMATDVAAREHKHPTECMAALLAFQLGQGLKLALSERHDELNPLMLDLSELP